MSDQTVTYQEILGRSLHLLREGRGMTQSELATKSGLSQSSLSRMEKGLSSPDASQVESIAAALGLPTYKIFLMLDHIREEFRKRGGKVVNQKVDAAALKQEKYIAGVFLTSVISKYVFELLE